MRRNVLVLGERTMSGNLGRVIVCGEAEITQSDVSSLYVAGEADISRSTVQKMKVAGQVNAEKSCLKTATVRGAMHLKSECSAETVDLVGELEAEYFTCKKLVCKAEKNNSETTTIKGYVKANCLENRGNLYLEGNSNFETICNYSALTVEEGIECNAFFSFGPVNTPQINGEQVYLYTGWDGFVKLVTGTQITLSSRWNPGKQQRDLKPQPQTFDTADKILTVGQIEGDTIWVDHVKAQSVSGIDVEIGDLCVIDQVEYSGKLTVSPKAVVLEKIKR